ncbi:MFS transporter [Tessaracoccus sp. HDW20]|nr:MFS transporter [Tessaracoccus coleopterorum]
MLKVMSAPLLFLADSLGYLASWCFLLMTRDHEAEYRATRPPRADRNLVAEIREGLRFVIRQPAISRITFASFLSNFASTATYTLVPIVVLRLLGFTPFEYGLIMTLGAIGGLLGASMAGRIGRRVGTANAVRFSTLSGLSRCSATRWRCCWTTGSRSSRCWWSDRSSETRPSWSTTSRRSRCGSGCARPPAGQDERLGAVHRVGNHADQRDRCRHAQPGARGRQLPVDHRGDGDAGVPAAAAPAPLHRRLTCVPPRGNHLPRLLAAHPRRPSPPPPPRVPARSPGLVAGKIGQ